MTNVDVLPDQRTSRSNMDPNPSNYHHTTDRLDPLGDAQSGPGAFGGYHIAAIIPCHNEEAAISHVVKGLRAAVPNMDIYVYDNRSTDRTAEVAADAGAIVRKENLKGKGNVVRRAFADIEADVYLLIDGDDTYDTGVAPQLIAALLSGPYDHVLGIRETVQGATAAYRPNHEFGNKMITGIVASIFGNNVEDMLSGYRAFSRRFVKSFPAVSREFEIETELTVHCLALRVPSTSVRAGYRDRAAGTESKLRTYRDGSKILRLIANLTRHERPIAFYGALASVLLMAALLFSTPVIVDYMSSGLVPKFPSLSASLALATVALLLFVTGLILDGIRKSRHEASRLAYLSVPALRPADDLELVGDSGADSRNKYRMKQG